MMPFCRRRHRNLIAPVLFVGSNETHSSGPIDRILFGRRGPLFRVARRFNHKKCDRTRIHFRGHKTNHRNYGYYHLKIESSNNERRHSRNRMKSRIKCIELIKFGQSNRPAGYQPEYDPKCGPGHYLINGRPGCRCTSECVCRIAACNECSHFRQKNQTKAQHSTEPSSERFEVQPNHQPNRQTNGRTLTKRYPLNCGQNVNKQNAVATSNCDIVLASQKADLVGERCDSGDLNYKNRDFPNGTTSRINNGNAKIERKKFTQNNADKERNYSDNSTQLRASRDSSYDSATFGTKSISKMGRFRNWPHAGRLQDAKKERRRHLNSRMNRTSYTNETNRRTGNKPGLCSTRQSTHLSEVKRKENLDRKEITAQPMEDGCRHPCKDRIENFEQISADASMGDRTKDYAKGQLYGCAKDRIQGIQQRTPTKKDEETVTACSSHLNYLKEDKERNEAHLMNPAEQENARATEERTAAQDTQMAEQVEHLNNQTKYQTSCFTREQIQCGLLKMHLFTNSASDQNRGISFKRSPKHEFQFERNDCEEQNAVQAVNSCDHEASHPFKALPLRQVSHKVRHSKFKATTASNNSRQKSMAGLLAKIQSFILLLAIMCPHLYASELLNRPNFQNQTADFLSIVGKPAYANRMAGGSLPSHSHPSTSDYNDTARDRLNSINSFKSLDLLNPADTFKPINSIASMGTLNSISTITLDGVLIDDVTPTLFSDSSTLSGNATSTSLASRTTTNYPTELAYRSALANYQNQLALESNSINETNFTSSLYLKDKWFLKFFPDQYKDTQMELSEFLFRLFGVLICSVLLCLTLFGNVLTITVVLRFNRMKTVTNILLASLAVADITVALLVMPFLMINDYLRSWPFGAAICHFYISCDVMCCTASIQHLCAVAIDRYWAINKPLHYHRLVNKRRLVFSIVLIWLVSIAISFIPVFSGIYHEKNLTASEIFLMNDYPNCSLQVNILYAIFSSTISFYLPLPIMFYVYIRILLIAERQNREIKQLENHLRFNGVNYRNSAPAVTANLDARSSTTNITTNSLPIEHTRHLVHPPQSQQQQLQQQQMQQQQLQQQQMHHPPGVQPPHLQSQLQPLAQQMQPVLDMFLHGIPSCVYACHCHCGQMNPTNLNPIANQPNETAKKETKDNKEPVKDLNSKEATNPKDANNNTDQPNKLESNVGTADKSEDQKDAGSKPAKDLVKDLANEKTKSNKMENSIQRRSKYISKQFDVTLQTSGSLEGKESEDQSGGDRLSQESSIKKENSTLTQSVSTPVVPESGDPQAIKQRTSSNPNLEQQPNRTAETKQSSDEDKPAEQKDKQERPATKEEQQQQPKQPEPINQPLAFPPHSHCCCFNQHVMFCAHQLQSKILQQNLQQQQQQIQQQQQAAVQPNPQPANLQQPAINPLTFAQNLLNILATNFPPLGEHTNELRDGYSSTSTSTLNNLGHPQQQQQQQQLVQQANEANQAQYLNPQCLSTMQQLTGINIQFQPNAQLNSMHQFNQFLQQNNLSNLICDHQHSSPAHSNQVQSQSTPAHQIAINSCPAQDASAAHHPTCCNAGLLGWTNRKCSDTSTVSGPMASCSSVTNKSMCSTSTAHCHHLHSIHSLPIYSIYSTNLPIDTGHQAAALNHPNVQFDVNSLTGLHQPRSNSGSSVQVLDEIKRAERQLRKRSKQILTDTKAIRTLGIVMGVFCVCWLPFFILYVLMAFWPDLPISYEWKSAVTWLGYLNSVMNPCIYALLNKEFKIAFKRVLHCHPRIMVHNASTNYGTNYGPAGQRRVGRGGALNHSYTQSFSGSIAGGNLSNRGGKRGFLSALEHGCQIMRELSSSGTFNRDLMEYSFGNGTTTCLLNLSGDTPNAAHPLNQRNQGIRISFDFAAGNDLVENSPNLISNCSTRQPSIASGLEIPILPAASQKLNSRQLSPQNIPKINKELLTVQSRPAGRSISSEDLIYVNAMDAPSSGCSGESTLSAPEQHGVRGNSSSACSSNKYLSKSSNQSSIRNKFKLSKYKKKKMKAEQQMMEKLTMKRSEIDENLNENNQSSKERVFLSVRECGAKKSSSYLSLLRRSTKRKNKTGQSYET